MKIAGLTLEDLERMGATIGPEAMLPNQPLAEGQRRPLPAEMNKTEALYWEGLLTRRHKGELLWCAFEPIKFRLADRTTYTPDFGVMLADRSLEFHETKGFVREDAAVKFKVVRQLYWMFRFRMFQRKKREWAEIYKDARGL